MHVGAAQVIMLLQKLLVQSALTVQESPFMHAGQVPPPQSVSVSLPFWTLSVQVGMVHVIVASQ
jgi:hypothetical protein